MILQGLLKKVFQFRNDSAKRSRKGADEGFDPEEKPFLDHLEDLRVMFFKIIIALFVGIGACLAFTRPLVDAIRMPMVWANVAEDDALKAIFNLHHRGIHPRFTPNDLVVTQGGILGKVVSEDIEKGISKVEIADGVQVRVKTNTIMGKIPSEEAKVSAEDLQRLSKQNILIMETFTPPEGLMIVLKLAFFSALVITFPFLLWFILEFVWPGLKQTEKRTLLPGLFIGFGLFLLGAIFAFRLGLPFALRWLSQWNYQHGMNPGWRVGYYIQFVTQVTLVFGIMFEFPVVVMALVHLEILTYKAMRDTRSYAIMILLVIAGFLTPPDPVTLILLGGPLVLLYEACIWMAYFVERKRRRLEGEEEKQRAVERAALEERRVQLAAQATPAGQTEISGSGNGASFASEASSGPSYNPETGYYEGGSESHDYGYQNPDTSATDDYWRSPDVAAGGGSQLVDINNATMEELQKLPGIGPKLAQQIIEARPFYSEEELEYHAYLPPSVIKLIRDRVTFH